ncbi:MAG TPA: hypothetical protein ENH25_05890 [candidate division Zixibacteria bacterium]|nr:hypothetical protein [candidate division Zixibacteria bacterium]
MIKTKIAIAALCLLALPGVTVFAGQGGFFEFEADCNLEILGEPDLHKPFEAIFTIIPRHDLIHTRGVEDTIKLKSYEGVTLLEGDTLWTGFMQRDKIYTLRARFVVDTAIYFRIHGVAKVVQALGIAAYPRGMDDMGAIATKAASSRLYDFTIHSQPTKPKIYCNEDSSIEITPVTIENLGPPPIISGPSKVQITQSTNKHIITNYEKNQSIGDTNYIYIDHQSVIKMDTIHIHPAKTNIFFFGRNIPNIQSQFEEMLPLNKINDSTYEMNTTDYLPEKLDILINDTTKIIPIRSLSIYTVCGEASYVDNESNINPCEHITVALYYCHDDNCDSWEYIDYTVTDYQGAFCFIADSPVILIALWADNDAATISYAEDHDLSDGDLLKTYNHTIRCKNYSFIDSDIPDEYLRINNLDSSGAYNILNCIRQGKSYLENELGLMPPLKNTAIWDVLDNTHHTSSFGGFLVADIPGFYIASKANYLDNWDEWDESVILHEYGHYVMYNYMQNILEATGGWFYLVTTSGANNLHLAMSEGWANFFSALVRDDPLFINADYYDPLWDVYEYEISKPDPAYYTSNYNYPANPPWQYSPQWEGASVPGSINVSLWNIYDEFDDDNYMEGSYIWGHNNDHNSSCYWRGIDAMWDVLTNFDPQPNNSDHDYCWNIYEFIHGWRTFGYPVDSVFVNIFEAHGVAVFIPGDADNDKSVNVLDATCIINYLYKGLPAPEHLSAADINADCGVNLLDVTCLINYLYRGGPAPLVGCYNYYSS